MKLTEAQHAAMVRFLEYPTLYPYNGVSRATLYVLDRLGLVEVTWRTPTIQYGSLGSQGGRGRVCANWSAVLTEAGRDYL